MAKTKNLSFKKYISSINNFEVFKEEYSMVSKLLFSFIGILIVSIINILINSRSINGFSRMTSFLYTFIGFPILLLFIFGIFFIFVKSFNSRINKKFIDSFIVFFLISMLFYTIEYFLVYIRLFTLYNQLWFFITSLFVYLIAIYYVYTFIRTYINYFNTDGYKIVSSLILTYITILTFALLNYLVYLIGSLA